MFDNVDHVALRVADYDASLRFYTETLGFNLETEWTLGDAVPGVRFAYVRLGDFKIELIGDGAPEPLPPTGDLGQHLSRSGYIHLCLHVESLDSVLAELRRRGVVIFAEPFEVEPIKKRLAMIKDNRRIPGMPASLARRSGGEVSVTAGTAIGREDAAGHLEGDRPPRVPDAPLFEWPGVGHAPVADAVKQSRRAEFVR
jgi:glyoxylase I family protein